MCAADGVAHVPVLRACYLSCGSDDVCGESAVFSELRMECGPFFSCTFVFRRVYGSDELLHVGRCDAQPSLVLCSIALVVLCFETSARVWLCGRTLNLVTLVRMRAMVLDGSFRRLRKLFSRGDITSHALLDSGLLQVPSFVEALLRIGSTFVYVLYLVFLGQM